MDALDGRERVARALGMLHWTREALARRVIAELGPLPDDRLKWEVAARLYGADDPVQEAIRQRLADVSD